MEAPIRPFLTILLSTIFTAFSFTTYFSYVNCILHESDVYTEPSDIFDLVNRHCVVVLFSSEDQRYDDVYLQLETAFHKERDVTLRRVGYAPDQFYWNRNEPLQWMSKPVEIITKSRIGVFKKKKTDRTCLMLPTNGKATKPKAEAYTGPVNAKSILEFINEKCETYRSLSGELSPEGLHRENLLENLFYVSSISNITMQLWANCSKENGGDTCWRSSHSSFIKVNNPDVCPLASDVHKETKQGNLQASTSSKSGKIPDKTTKPKQTLPECERIAIPTWETFFDDYLKHSRPVIIKDAFNHWPAMKKWTTEYLRNKYGKKDVHIKLAPNGHFEGVEKASLWEDFATFNIPNQVKDSLQYPDLVVVRPATMNLNFSAFLDTMTGNSTFDMKGSTGVRVSAYLEYSSIPQYLPELEKDIEFPFVKNKLKRRHLNIWLSDGNTLGKLHFDPFDNFLCQVSCNGFRIISFRIICSLIYF